MSAAAYAMSWVIPGKRKPWGEPHGGPAEDRGRVAEVRLGAGATRALPLEAVLGELVVGCCSVFFGARVAHMSHQDG